jgi:hypothetical protein
MENNGRWSEDKTHFIYDYERIAKETGYTVNQVKLYGVAYVRNHPKQKNIAKDVQTFPSQRRFDR